MKKIGIVTGTRAEYGLLKTLIRKFDEDIETEMKLIVTGSHLSSEYGNTVNEIENDGFLIDKKIEMLLSASTSSAVLKSMAVEMMAFADYLQENPLDIIVLLGDRYEILIAATAAMIFNIPIAHIHGGELTEGLIDDVIRHAVTKMSAIHFPSTQEYKNRIIQLGEQPNKVYYVGALGVESASELSLLSKETLEKDLNISFERKTIMITYHPVTLESSTAKEQFQSLLNVLDQEKDFQYIFTMANADMEGNHINSMIEEYVKKNRERSRCYTSLGQLKYLSVLKYCYMVLGNSSSGIVEVPTFKIPTVNIGNRQKGRIAADSVIHCNNTEFEIKNAIKIASSQEFRDKIKTVKNPYYKLNTSSTIVQKIKEYLNENNTISKEFFNLN